MNKLCKNVRILNETISSLVGQAVAKPLEFKPARQVVQYELNHSIKVATFE